MIQYMLFCSLVTFLGWFVTFSNLQLAFEESYGYMMVTFQSGETTKKFHGKRVIMLHVSGIGRPSDTTSSGSGSRWVHMILQDRACFVVSLSTTTMICFSYCECCLLCIWDRLNTTSWACYCQLTKGVDEQSIILWMVYPLCRKWHVQTLGGWCCCMSERSHRTSPSCAWFGIGCDKSLQPMSPLKLRRMGSIPTMRYKAHSEESSWRMAAKRAGSNLAPSWFCEALSCFATNGWQWPWPLCLRFIRDLPEWCCVEDPSGLRQAGMTLEKRAAPAHGWSTFYMGCWERVAVNHIAFTLHQSPVQSKPFRLNKKKRPASKGTLKRPAVQKPLIDSGSDECQARLSKTKQFQDVHFAKQNRCTVWCQIIPRWARWNWYLALLRWNLYVFFCFCQLILMTRF